MTHWRKPRDCPQAAHDAWCVHPKCDCFDIKPCQHTPCKRPDCNCGEPKHWASYDEFMLLKAPPPPSLTARILAGIAALALLAYLIYPAVAAEPFYCKPLERFERSCAGVRTAVATLGKDRAMSIAKQCGASEADIAQAEDCLRIPVTQPEKQ